MDRIFKVCVYGTLKKGGKYHNHYCSKLLDFQPAQIVGKIYDLPQGYPAVQLSKDYLLEEGSLNYKRDLALDSVPETDTDYLNSNERVFGELFTFPAEEEILVQLDYLEGFHGDKSALYLRHRYPVFTENGVEAAWVYHQERSYGTFLPDGIWP